MVSADRFEASVWSAIVKVLRQPELLAKKLEAHQARVGVRQVEVRAGLDMLLREFVDVERQEERLLDAYLDEQLQIPSLRERLVEIAERKAALSARIAHVRQQLASQETEEARQDQVRRFCRVALRGLGKLTDEGRQRLLRALVDEIVLGPDFIEIRGVLPGRWTPEAVDRKRPEPSETRVVNDPRPFLVVIRRAAER